MSLGVVGSDGQRMPLHWFEIKEGRRGVDQRHYMEVMNDIVMPWIEETYGDKGRNSTALMNILLVVLVLC